ncbi:hypothetical protein [Nocardia sp. NPDC051832]|uniref:hypothetical protein n=1 Tax=Nocardia sp. NPDC051832 TaxID=3155673 RepID=UPI003413D4CB
MPGADAQSWRLNSFIDDIGDRALRYTEKLDDPEHGETDALRELAAHVEVLIDRPILLALGRRGNQLMFGTLYDKAAKVKPGEEAWRAPLLAGLMAAEVEFRGPLRLSQTQNTLLAAKYQTLAGELTRYGLLAHAVLAWRRTVALHHLTEDVQAEDRCGLALARARRQATPRGWRRALSATSDLLCGYGYRPFWLLGWVAVQILVCTVLALVWAGSKSWTEVVYLGTTTFLGPLGPANTEGMAAPARILFAAETWLGAVSMSVFFALLVRRWFRQ